jgi:hypothetical protein
MHLLFPVVSRSLIYAPSTPQKTTQGQFPLIATFSEHAAEVRDAEVRDTSR